MSSADVLTALAQSGLLPQQQLMGAQMKLGMVTRPDGPDRVTSDLEFGPGERFVVNGIQMR